MSGARHGSIWRRFSTVVVAAAIVLILGLVSAVAMAMGRTTDRIGDLAYAVTGTANAHREVLKMEIASARPELAGTQTVKEHRAFFGQQIRLSLIGLEHRADPNLAVPEMREDLARVDAAIAANGNNPPSAELQQALAELEVSMKHVYDNEEARYFDLNNRALKAQETSERFLLLLAGSITLAGTILLVGTHRAARANLRQKAAELAVALGELEESQSDRRRLLDETVRATERERVRLAAELHDGPIQALAALCIRLDRAERKLRVESADAAVPLVSSVRDDLGDEVASLRRVMSELRPPALDEAGLGGATRDYVEAFSARTRCDATVDVELVDGALTQEREVVLYRLVQEALTNVSRHSQANRVRVHLRATSDGVELRVADNGVGFDPTNSSDLIRTGHYGLAGMRERVESGEGRFSVQSRPGAGVEIIATLPASFGSGDAESAA